MQPFNTRNWYEYLTQWQQQLVEVTGKLINKYEDGDQEYLVDYSFLVFPMAKAYEGFLKKLLFDFSLIDQQTYEGKLFRIGRALNPHIPSDQHDEYWLYDDLAKYCSKDTADKIWKAWLYCRNRVFHFFPKDTGLLTYNQAIEKVLQLDRAMAEAVTCYRDSNHDHD